MAYSKSWLRRPALPDHEHARHADALRSAAARPSPATALQQQARSNISSWLSSPSFAGCCSGPRANGSSARSEQLELKLEEMEAIRAERAIAQRTSLNDDATKPSRRPLPEHLPREVHTRYDLPSDACPVSCGGELRKFPAKISPRCSSTFQQASKVLRHVRPKLSCRSCEKVVQAEAPSLASPSIAASPALGLLAHVLVANIRRPPAALSAGGEIYARERASTSIARRSPTGSAPRVSCYAHLSRK